METKKIVFFGLSLFPGKKEKMAHYKCALCWCGIPDHQFHHSQMV